MNYENIFFFNIISLVFSIFVSVTFHHCFSLCFQNINHIMFLKFRFILFYMMTQGAAQHKGKHIGIMAAPWVASFSSLAYFSFLLSMRMLATAPLDPRARPSASPSATTPPVFLVAGGSAGTRTVVALPLESCCVQYSCPGG